MHYQEVEKLEVELVPIWNVGGSFTTEPDPKVEFLTIVVNVEPDRLHANAKFLEEEVF